MSPSPDLPDPRSHSELIEPSPFDCPYTPCRRTCSLEFHAGSREGLSVFTSASPGCHPSFDHVLVRQLAVFPWPKMLDLMVHRTSWECIDLSYKKPKQQMHRHGISYETRIASRDILEGVTSALRVLSGQEKIQPHLLILLVITSYCSTECDITSSHNT